jgi:hypothetical protein
MHLHITGAALQHQDQPEAEPGAALQHGALQRPPYMAGSKPTLI